MSRDFKKTLGFYTFPQTNDNIVKPQYSAPYKPVLPNKCRAIISFFSMQSRIRRAVDRWRLTLPAATPELM